MDGVEETSVPISGRTRFMSESKLKKVVQRRLRGLTPF